MIEFVPKRKNGQLFSDLWKSVQEIYCIFFFLFIKIESSLWYKLLPWPAYNLLLTECDMKKNGDISTL